MQFSTFDKVEQDTLSSFHLDFGVEYSRNSLCRSTLLSQFGVCYREVFLVERFVFYENEGIYVSSVPQNGVRYIEVSATNMSAIEWINFS